MDDVDVREIVEKLLALVYAIPPDRQEELLVYAAALDGDAVTNEEEAVG